METIDRRYIVKPVLVKDGVRRGRKLYLVYDLDAPILGARGLAPNLVLTEPSRAAVAAWFARRGEECDWQLAPAAVARGSAARAYLQMASG